MYYEDEKIILGADICCFFFALISLISIIGAINGFLNNDYGLGILLLFLLLLLPIGLISFYVGIFNIINAKKNRTLAKMIMDNGVKVQGIVTDIVRTEKDNYKKSMFKRASFFRRKNVHYGDNTFSVYHYAKVTYNYNDKKYNIVTPYLEFYPADLTDKNVDVYIYNDLCYVTNYQINSDKIKENKANHNKMNVSILIAFLIMALIFALIIYLYSINVIDINHLKILFPTVGIIYLIASCIIITNYLKK